MEAGRGGTLGIASEEPDMYPNGSDCKGNKFPIRESIGMEVFDV